MRCHESSEENLNHMGGGGEGGRAGEVITEAWPNDALTQRRWRGLGSNSSTCKNIHAQE